MCVCDFNSPSGIWSPATESLLLMDINYFEPQFPPSVIMGLLPPLG